MANDLKKSVALAAEVRELQRKLDELRSRIDDRLTPEELPEGDIEILLCRAFHSRFGIPLHAVEEVVAMAELTEVPEAPEWFSGLLNLGGETVPVVDVTCRIRGLQREVSADDFIVICKVGGRSVGFVLQEIFDVARVERESLAHPERGMPHAPYLLGTLQIDGAQVLLLSIERLLALSDLPELAS